MAYSPASNLSTSSSLAHLATVYYDRKALKPLRKKFLFWKGVDNRVQPLKNGKTIQFFRYSQLGANTSTTSEGTVGTAIGPMTSGVVSATVAQYSDFMSFSDMLVDTAIDDVVAVGADQLGYRAGLTCDTIVRNEFDGVAASVDVLPLGDYLSSADLANIRSRFAALDIQPPSGEYFPMICSPYNIYDLQHDPAVNGFADVVKQDSRNEGHNTFYTMGGTSVAPKLRFNSCEVYESNNVTMVAGSPNKYRCYFFGDEGIAAIDLAGRGPSRSMDQDSSKFSINVIKESGPSLANPEGKIRALASYNFVFVTKILDTTNYRIRKIDAATSLGL
jgi:N4-gp56 family major capsid protein